jgi:hypothetical protein
MNPTEFSDLAWIFDDAVPKHVSFEAFSAKADDELTAPESELVASHVAECSICHTTWMSLAPEAAVESALASKYRVVAPAPIPAKTAAVATAMAEWDGLQLGTATDSVSADTPTEIDERRVKPPSNVVPFLRRRSTRFFGAAAVVAALTVGSTSVLQSAFVGKQSDTASNQAAETSATKARVSDEAETGAASAPASIDSGAAAETVPVPNATGAAEAAETTVAETTVTETTVAAAEFDGAGANDSEAVPPQPAAAERRIDEAPATDAPSAAAEIEPPAAAAPATNAATNPIPVPTSPPLAPVPTVPPSTKPAPVPPPRARALPATTQPVKAAAKTSNPPTTTKARAKRTVKKKAVVADDLGSLGPSETVEAALVSFGSRVGLVAEPVTIPAAAVAAPSVAAPVDVPQPGVVPPDGGAPVGPPEGSPPAANPAVPTTAAPVAAPAAPAPATTAAPAVAAAPAEEVSEAPPDPTCSVRAQEFGRIVRRATATVTGTGEIRIYLVTKDTVQRFIVFNAECAVLSNRLALEI